MLKYSRKWLFPVSTCLCNKNIFCCRCEALGLVSRCLFVEPREATEKEILVQHSVEQIEILKATMECKDEELLEDLSSRYDAIYIHPVSRKLFEIASSRHGHRNSHNNPFRIHSCKGVV